MRRSIATVCLSGTLDEKLAAAARAGFDGVELFEADLVNSPLPPGEVRLLTEDLGLTIVDLDPQRAEACVRRLRSDRIAPGTLDSLKEADGLIHATPTGMEGHPGLPLDEELLHPRLWVAEVVYRPLDTQLLQRAREIGCRTLDGGAMAVFQAADSFELFTGLQPDRERMLRHFAELADQAVSAG